MTDPIADMLTRIRNAQMRKHEAVAMPTSKVKVAMLRILRDEGLIRDYKVIGIKPFQEVKVALKYDDAKAPVISGLRRVSKPGLRVYVGHESLPLVKRGMGVAIVSTSKGLMTARAARRSKIGGEVLCHLW